MMTLGVFFFLSMGLFIINGMLRGWYRELLGTFGIISAYFVIWFFSNQIHFINNLSLTNQFIVKSLILVVMLFFGYHVPRWREPRRNLGTLVSAILGGILGAVNSYLIVGSLWAYLDDTGYYWHDLVSAPHDALSISIATHLPSFYFSNGTLVLGSVLVILILILVEII